MTNITSYEYWNEVESLAKSIIADAMAENDNDKDAAMDDINDSRLHATIDGHQWVIYTAYNLDVYQHSENSDYFIDNFGNDEAGAILKDRGLDGLHAVIAFYALYADVQDKINELADEIEGAA